MYKLFLGRERGVWLYLAGIFALTMRQTNIFWVAVYMGGLEVVRTLKDIQPAPNELPDTKTWKELAIATFNRYARGEIHDVSLKDAEVYGILLWPLKLYLS
jgi:alpha-1,2-glucosyltransferase